MWEHCKFVKKGSLLQLNFPHSWTHFYIKNNFNDDNSNKFQTRTYKGVKPSMIVHKQQT
jgi:hypothetical protein